MNLCDPTLKIIHSQIAAYRKLERHIANYRKILVLSFDESAGNIFLNLRKIYPRLGAMDLKIASITMVHQAILLTLNTKDFGQIQVCEPKIGRFNLRLVKTPPPPYDRQCPMTYGRSGTIATTHILCLNGRSKPNFTSTPPIPSAITMAPAVACMGIPIRCGLRQRPPNYDRRNTVRIR